MQSLCLCSKVATCIVYWKAVLDIFTKAAYCIMQYLCLCTKCGTRFVYWKAVLDILTKAAYCIMQSLCLCREPGTRSVHWKTRKASTTCCTCSGQNQLIQSNSISGASRCTSKAWAPHRYIFFGLVPFLQHLLLCMLPCPCSAACFVHGITCMSACRTLSMASMTERQLCMVLVFSGMQLHYLDVCCRLSISGS